MDKYEFASPAWLAVLRELFAVYAKKIDPALEFSICEIYTDVPKHLDRHGTGVIAWHCLIKDRVARFAETAIPEADLRSQSDYAFILTISRKLFAPDAMAEVQAELARGAAQGKHISTSRDESKVPPAFMDLHNDIVRRTL
jgi:hypothetical protein